MRAAVVEKANKLRLQDIEIPELQEGEALIKVRYTGICGTDVHVLHGKLPTAKFPIVIGHEFVGEVVKVKGKGTDKFKPGDLVVAQPFYSCGQCEACARGKDNICKELSFMGTSRNGTFADYTKVLTRKMYKVPKQLDPELAALTEPIAVAIHDVRESGLRVADRVLVIGGGPIGLLIAIIARHGGASMVVISEVSKYRREVAKKLGFITIDPLKSDFDKTLKDMTDQNGFHVVFEASGVKPGILTAVEHAAIAGSVMVVGIPPEAYPVELYKVFAKELHLKGVRIHSQINFMGAIELLKSGVLNDQFRSLITKCFFLDQIEQAFDYVGAGGDFFKILIKN